MSQKHIAINLTTLILAFMSCFVGCGKQSLQFADVQDQVEPLQLSQGKHIVASNDQFDLIVDSETAAVQIYNRITRNTYQAAPSLSGNEDTTGLAKSMVDIVYYNGYSKIGTMNSYDDAVVNNQVQYFYLDGGIRILYTLGKIQKEYVVPPVIEKSRFEDLILDKTDELSREMLLVYYRLIDLNAEDVTEEEKKEILKKYPLAENHVLYVLAADYAEYVLEEIEGYISPSGYTKEQLAEDKQKWGISSSATATQFTIPIDLTLNDDGISVSVNVQKIQSAQEQDVLTEIHLFRNFEAAGKDDKGYFLVPDGSGALIHFNNGKANFPSYSQAVYGTDKTYNIYTKGENEQQACLPVFGVSGETQSSFAVIEQGAALSHINAGVLGKNSPNNYVYASFQIRPFEVAEISMEGNEGINNYSPAIYDGKLTVRYFLMEKNSGYVEMAKTYRSYLSENEMIKTKTESDFPFLLRLEGAVDNKESVLGIPMTKKVALTTFEQATDILKYLSQEKISHIQLQYDSCFNGGRQHSVLNKGDFVTALGNTSELNMLLDYIKKIKGNVYFDADVQYVFQDKWFDDFDTYQDVSKTLDKELAVNRNFNYSTLKATKYQAGYIVSSDRYHQYFNSFLKDVESLALTGLSVGYLGTDINSNFNKTNPINREQAKEDNCKVLNQVHQNGLLLFSRGANEYALKYTDYITNFPLQSSRKYIQDEEVPFYAIVAHGSVTYAGESMNSSSDMQHLILKSIESGAVPYFDWVAADNMTLKNLGIQAYSVCYKYWLDKAVSIYNMIDVAIGDLQNIAIVDHKRVSDNVFCTAYENGQCVYVNYSDTDYLAGTIVVPANSYARGKTK